MKTVYGVPVPWYFRPDPDSWWPLNPNRIQRKIDQGYYQVFNSSSWLCHLRTKFFKFGSQEVCMVEGWFDISGTEKNWPYLLMTPINLWSTSSHWRFFCQRQCTVTITNDSGIVLLLIFDEVILRTLCVLSEFSSQWLRSDFVPSCTRALRVFPVSTCDSTLDLKLCLLLFFFQPSFLHNQSPSSRSRSSWKTTRL